MGTFEFITPIDIQNIIFEFLKRIFFIKKYITLLNTLQNQMYL